MDTDRTATDLVTIADNIVGVCQRRTGVLVEGIQELGFWRREGVVHGSPCGVPQCDISRLGGLCGRLKERRIHNPQERPLAVLDKAGTVTDLNTGSAQQSTRLFSFTGGEEDAVPGVGAGCCSKTCTFLISDILRNRTSQFAVFLHEYIGQALRTALLCPFLPCIQGAARLRSTAGHHHGTHVGSLKHTERGVGKVIGKFGQLKTKTQIWLVGTVFLHRFGIGHTANRTGNLHINQVPDSLDNAFAQVNNVVLIYEGCLNIELSELRLTVRTEVLIAVASSNLVVLFNAAHLQELFK